LKKEDLGFILFLAGIGIIILMLSADFLGFTGDPSTIGWKQWLGAGGGLIVFIAGIWLIRAAKDKD
jgi:hypothetical protein